MRLVTTANDKRHGRELYMDSPGQGRHVRMKNSRIRQDFGGEKYGNRNQPQNSVSNISLMVGWAMPTLRTGLLRKHSSSRRAGIARR